MKKLLRNWWCLWRHRSVPGFWRWRPVDASGVLWEMYCGRCEHGRDYPGKPERYSGPVERRWFRWRPVKGDAR
jgi:hypothetical protein